MHDLERQILLTSSFDLGTSTGTNSERRIWRRNDLVCTSLVHTDVAEWQEPITRSKKGSRLWRAALVSRLLEIC